ncbi:hypothetical protein [Teredinibacter purpureus]|uniref:hypothetical protein n=1 Tax=Teredinibacter purpureus TaxID=2731756 RepID=UPI0013C4D98B|nr:hypothetical protein [Teredinibacter purpureus]
MSKNVARKKATYFLVFALVMVALGAYSTYAGMGFSIGLIPQVISYIGIALLFTEAATGNIAIVNLSEWKKVEIGVYGKLALLFLAVGGLTNSFAMG